MAIAPALPSASVIVLRDAGAHPEVLLVRRNSNIAFHGGSWVFPGGKVDDADKANDAAPDPQRVAVAAAVREAREETGLQLRGDRLIEFSHWTTPDFMPKRFATWFFLAEAPAQSNVQVDASEIVDHRWMSCEAALAARADGEIELPAPTFVSLTKLATHRSVSAILAHYGNAPLERFVPRIVKLEDGRCALYQEDAGYETTTMEAPGARHRLEMREAIWRYQREL